MGLKLFAARAPSSEPYSQYAAKARLYEYSGRIFVCSVAGIVETESLTEFQADVDLSTLGEAILKHLSEFVSEIPANLRGYKMTDWAAYDVSGARSVKAFERLLWHVDLAIMNSAVLVWAQPRLTIREELSAYASANRNFPEQVGSAVRRAIAAAKVLREQGLV